MAACVGGMALAWGVGGFTALHAASRDVTLTPPYTAAEHNTNVHCPDSEPWAVCRASAEVDAATGHMALSSSVDSGANGTTPSSAASAVANGELIADLGIAPYQRHTVAVHLHVTDVAVSSSSDGRARLVVWARAQCDGCTATPTQYAMPARDGDLTLTITLMSGASSGARVLIGASADSGIDCHDFCIATTGTGRTSASVTVAGIDASDA